MSPALALSLAKLALGAWVLHRGFTHVSDDDYARTVIAEQFAHAPRLDPSATSWLPFPFWVEGWTMVALGRSLAVARLVAVALGAASVLAPYRVMIAARVPRIAAATAVAIAMALPWNAWLAVATVPEAWTGALVAAAAIAMASGAGRPWAAAALLAASLSRYEAWPACAVMVAVCFWHALRAARAGQPALREVACGLVAALGPLAWMAWNGHAHGDPLHFLARVSAFRHAIGAADIPAADKVLGYPRAFLEESPEAAILGVVGAIGAARCARLRARWQTPGAVAIAIMVFLVIGDLGDGAPTHHAARALAPVWWISIGAGVDATASLLGRRATGEAPPWRRAARWGAAVVATAWCAALPSRWSGYPGRGEAERRDVQLARGLDLRSRDVARASITPCAFEHFALIAAWAAPERAEVGPRTGEPLTPACPRVVER